jgi:hypothetical protein
MTIRPFSPADADAVNAVAVAAFAQYQGVYDDWEALMRGVGSTTSLAGSGEIIVARMMGMSSARLPIFHRWPLQERTSSSLNGR